MVRSFFATALPVLLFALIDAKRLPATFKTCKLSESSTLKACFRANVEDAIRQMKQPIPSLNFGSVEPLSITTIDAPAKKGPISFSQYLSNIKMYGVSASKILNFELQVGEKEYVITAESLTPRITILGDYRVDGRILVLPVVGQGQCNITLLDLVASHRIPLQITERKGKQYLLPTDFVVKLSPKRLIIDYENLFNGDKRLSKQLQQFVNDNWQDVFEDIRPVYQQAFAQVFLELTNRIFSRVPKDEIFIP